MFTPDQKAILLRYNYGMTSTYRRNADMMQRCASEVGTTIERVNQRSIVPTILCMRGYYAVLTIAIPEAQKVKNQGEITNQLDMLGVHGT